MTGARVGQVGLGVIGQLYVTHLLEARGTVVVHDIDERRVAEAAGLGATAATSAADVGRRSDEVLVALPAPPAVMSALTGPEGLLEGMAEGGLVLDVSTVDPETSRAIHGLAAERGIAYLDAPVSGGMPGGAGTDGARAGNVSFMVGGDRAAYERAIPLMEIVGARHFYLGPAGAGSTVKLISNLIAGLHNLVASEAFVLGAAAGIPPETLLEVFDGTDAKSFWLTEYFAPRIERRDFEPGFSVDLQYKDHRLASELGRRLGVPLLLNDLAAGIYQSMRASGLGSRDLVESVNFLGRLSGADIYEPRDPEG